MKQGSWIWVEYPIDIKPYDVTKSEWYYEHTVKNSIEKPIKQIPTIDTPKDKLFGNPKGMLIDDAGQKVFFATAKEAQGYAKTAGMTESQVFDLTTGAKLKQGI